IITGTLTPTAGEVRTNGRIAALLELGSGFNPDFTGRENVYLNGALLGLTRKQIDERFDAIASFADIGDHLEQPVKTYSSGMLVRLAFAVQVQVEPDILIVDEALAVGDALFQKRCFQRIEKLLSCGTTLLFVSHDQENVRTLTNRALLLKEGRSKAWGISSEVILEYRRLLHEDESAYFTSITHDLAARTQTNESMNKSESVEKPEDSGSQSEKLSFGEGEVRISQVHTLDSDNNPCTIFYPGQVLRIKITCQAYLATDKLNVAIRIRNKEGIKIYSWGTLNQDIQTLSSGHGEAVFWKRNFYAGEVFDVVFECPCNIGVNLYEIQAAVSYEHTVDYLGQRILHWIDEAAFFQVLIKQDHYFFGGVVDLQMKARW
ncbi:MAG: ABC transporter ATP-binding protein, partial [Gammaproteobacteria bacterium]